MKRAPSDDLFKLIRSLTKGEKRNFKLLAGLLASDKDKKYLELFDVIEKQDSYDEARVLKQMKALYGGQLAVGKHYLYKLILRSLAYFRTNPSTALVGILDQARALTEKDLYPQAQKLLRKGLQEVILLEDFETHYAMLGLQLELLLRMYAEKDLAKHVEEIEGKRAVLLSKMANLDEYSVLQNKLIISASLSAWGDKVEAKSLTDHPLVRDIGQAKSTRAKILFHSLHRRFCLSSNDLEKSLEHSDALLGLYDEWPLLKANSIKDYFLELNNLCVCLLRLGRYQEAFVKMEEFRLFRNDFPKARVDFFKWYYVLVLGAGIHVGNPERVLEIEKELKNEWSDMEGKLPKSIEMWLRYMMAYSFFMLHDPKSALQWVNLLLADPRSEVRINLQCSTRILNLLVHFELGNYILVESEVVNTRRFMEKHGQYNEFERQTLKCLKALCNAVDGPHLRQILEAWLVRMQAAEQTAKGKLPELVDVCGWIKSQLSGESIAYHRKEALQNAEVNLFPVRMNP